MWQSGNSKVISREDQETLRSAQDIINQLSVILRNAQIHNPGNVAVTTAIDRFLALLNPLMARDGSLTLQLVGEYFYCNDVRIRYALEYLLNFDYLAREFKKREIGTVVFLPGLRPSDVQAFLKGFLAAGFSSAPFDALRDHVSPLERIRVDILKKIAEGERDDTRKVVKKVYYNAVSFSKGVMTKIKSGEKVNIRKAKRIVESMVDHLLEEESLLIGMTAIKDYDEYTYHHSVNVSILSVALGQRLGLNKKMLTELGLVALFHDIGKIEVPSEILNKATSFTEEEWKIVKRHPIWGVRALLKLRGLDPTAIRSSIVAFEHHMNYDLSGYPRVRRYGDLDLYSRIVCIVDQYDAMTSARVYSRIPLAPDKALSIMMERAGKQLDPLLFKFFTNMVGIYPIGALVMLNTRELGLVYESDTVFLDRPRVLIIVDRSGNRLEKGPVVSLTEKDPHGNYLRSIVTTLDPNKYRINLAEYFL